jgi:hypothetical protein
LFELALGIYDASDALFFARNLNIFPYQGFERQNIVFGGVMEDDVIISDTLRRVNIRICKGRFHRLQPLFLSLCPRSSQYFFISRFLLETA